MKDINVQAQNKVTVVGKLLDVVTGEGQLSDGRHYERATLTIRTTQTYGGREETSEIPVSLFATQYTSTGKQNPAWTSMQAIKTLKTALMSVLMMPIQFVLAAVIFRRTTLFLVMVS